MASQRHPIIVSQRPMPPARIYVCELEEDKSTYTRVDPQHPRFQSLDFQRSKFQISTLCSVSFSLPRGHPVKPKQDCEGNMGAVPFVHTESHHTKAQCKNAITI